MFVLEIPPKLAGKIPLSMDNDLSRVHSPDCCEFYGNDHTSLRVFSIILIDEFSALAGRKRYRGAVVEMRLRRIFESCDLGYR